MHYAARYNNIDVMELLLEHGAGEGSEMVVLVKCYPKFSKLESKFWLAPLI